MKNHFVNSLLILLVVVVAACKKEEPEPVAVAQFHPELLGEYTGTITAKVQRQNPDHPGAGPAIVYNDTFPLTVIVDKLTQKRLDLAPEPREMTYPFYNRIDPTEQRLRYSYFDGRIELIPGEKKLIIHYHYYGQDCCTSRVYDGVLTSNKCHTSSKKYETHA